MQLCFCDQAVGVGDFLQLSLYPLSDIRTHWVLLDVEDGVDGRGLFRLRQVSQVLRSPLFLLFLSLKLDIATYCDWVVLLLRGSMILFTWFWLSDQHIVLL